jgi:RHS repeat-associated protein
MTTLDDVLDVGGPYRRLEFAYDWRSRRVSKKCFTGSPGSETVSDQRRFVYDGWNLISEYEVVGGDLTIDRTYARGIDLSGTLQGAGGVGGLLSFENGTACFVPNYDGNGNVIGWRKDTGACVAVCKYDAFGKMMAYEELEAGGADCPIGFSTKYEDSEIGLYYYGFRYYDPETGRWNSRDLIEELGGVNLYGILENDTIYRYGYLGTWFADGLGRNGDGHGFVLDGRGSLKVALSGGANSFQKLHEETHIVQIAGGVYPRGGKIMDDERITIGPIVDWNAIPYKQQF